MKPKRPKLNDAQEHAATTTLSLNGICPYFTMFPLEFPLRILTPRAKPQHRVLDPFCGRGTTNFAARLLGLETLGVDSSPVAAAITGSKLVNTTVDAITSEACAILDRGMNSPAPTGKFWQWAYDREVLRALCRFRAVFLEDCSTPARIALRGIILGALHGPKQKTFPSYFSNQCPRTYAPKPAYATRYWQSHALKPEPLDLLSIIERRAKRYFSVLPTSSGSVRLSDSRRSESFESLSSKDKFDWVITSPPYYGMRTYIPDQWLRNWFVGGPDFVDYGNKNQLVHTSPDDFAADLRQVWRNVAAACEHGARLVIRFGGISDRQANPKEVIQKSLEDSRWRVITIKSAGTASEGKRQADSFLRSKSNPLTEYDVWARLQ